MYFFTRPFSHSHFRAALCSLHSSLSPPSLHALSLTSAPRARLLHLPLRCRGGSKEVGVEVAVGWGRPVSGHGVEGGAWLPVCLRAPNESMIHGTRGSHRDRIRGALSNRSPERGKRYLICPPRRQLPLGYVCVCVCSEYVRRLVPPCPTPKPKRILQSCSKTDPLCVCSLSKMVD